MRYIRSLFAALIAGALALNPLPTLAAALTITASNVIWQDGPVDNAIAGEAFAAGAAVYLSASGTWLKAQDDGTAVEACSLSCGVALGTADVAAARVAVARPGATVSLGTGTAGVIYVLCDTAGGICPAPDALTTDKVTVIGVGIGSSKIYLGYLYNAGAVVP